MSKNRRFAAAVGLAALTLALLVTGCSQAAPAEEQPAASVFVSPLPTDRAEMQIAAPGGALPCGMGEVRWGYQVFRVDEFPACGPSLPNLTVLCLDGQAQWSAVNVSKIEVSADTRTVTFEVQQEGLCALFAVP